MSFTSDLLTGVAEYLAAEGIGEYRPDGSVFPTDATAIVDRTMPQSPARVVALDSYSVSDDPNLAQGTVGLHITTRAGGDPRDVEDLDDAIFDCLHGATNLDLNGVLVQQVYRQSNAPLGQDGNRRWQSTSNFYLDVHRPSRHRPD